MSQDASSRCSAAAASVCLIQHEGTPTDITRLATLVPREPSEGYTGCLLVSEPASTHGAHIPARPALKLPTSDKLPMQLALRAFITDKKTQKKIPRIGLTPLRAFTWRYSD